MMTILVSFILAYFLLPYIHMVIMIIRDHHVGLVWIGFILYLVFC